jgi:hypothetical protein
VIEQHPRARSPKVYCSTRCSKVAVSRRELLDVAA